MTSDDSRELAREKLKNLSRHLQVRSRATGEVNEIAPELGGEARDAFIQYRVMGEMHSIPFHLQNRQAGQSLDDLVRQDIGSSPRTGYVFGVQIVPSECQ